MDARIKEMSVMLEKAYENKEGVYMVYASPKQKDTNGTHLIGMKGTLMDIMLSMTEVLSSVAKDRKMNAEEISAMFNSMKMITILKAVEAREEANS